MFTIALTGGVASGKTAVADRFAAHSIDIIDADLVARKVVAPGTQGLAEVVREFGTDILDTSGALDRRAMRERIFVDDSARRRLEAIVHPLIRKGMRAGAEAARSPYVILAIPLFVESGAYGWVDRVLVVDVSREIQLRRLTARDGVTLDLAESMLAVQASREQRLAVANDVIDNSGDIASLDDTVAKLHRRYLELATQAAARG